MAAKNSHNSCALWMLFLLDLYCLESSADSRWIEWSAPTVSASATLELVGSRKGREEFLCEGGSKSTALLKVSVQDGIPPWRISVMRDGELFEKLRIEQQGMFGGVLNSYGASHVLNTSTPGVYSLGQLCDAHFCNGTVSTAAITVSVRQAPSAQFEPSCSAICLGNGTGFAPPRLQLAGMPPFSITFSPLDRGDKERAQESVTRRFDREGLHDLAAFPAAGAAAATASRICKDTHQIDRSYCKRMRDTANQRE
jgi:hypothetical protein